MRAKLGESLSSIQKFDTPIQEATTPSLEALEAYSLGMKTWEGKGDFEAIPFFRRAIELDSNFALAYTVLGVTYSNLGQDSLASENLVKAFELRGRISERERYWVSVNYYSAATGELEKANETCELWAQSYPRDDVPVAVLGNNYAMQASPFCVTAVTAVAATDADSRRHKEATMNRDERDLLDVLKFELEFLEKGGYGRSPREPWRPPFIFEDSPTCMNYDCKEDPAPCGDCVLMQLVPPELRFRKIPCRHIALNASGETLDSLYRYSDQHEIEETLRNWLVATIAQLEQRRRALCPDDPEPSPRSGELDGHRIGHSDQTQLSAGDGNSLPTAVH